MAERKSLTKKIRFEVFKRDSFTCQYCGSKAPDVILEIDHIEPISNGGKNELLNLLTSCFACNRGKSDRKLKDNTVLDKQRKQIEELNIRRQQLEMMLKWRDSELELKNEEQNKAIEYFSNKFSGKKLRDEWSKSLSKLVKKFGLINVLDSIDLAYDKYYQDWRSDLDNAIIIIDKIGGICYLKDKPEHLQKMSYIKGIAKNKFDLHQYQIGELMNLMNKYHEDGYCLDHLTEYIKNECTSFWSLKNLLK